MEHRVRRTTNPIAFVLLVSTVVLINLISFLGNDTSNTSSNFLYLMDHSSNTTLIPKKKLSAVTTKRITTSHGSITATAMGFAIGYDISVYHRFVGSLRRSGFQGHIILAVSPDLDRDIEAYLISRKVTIKKVQYVNCSYELLNETEVKDAHGEEVRTCIFPYHDLKARWGRFPLLRDYLEECNECTGSVLISDVRDTFFQRDPFGQDAPAVAGLQVFEEDKRMKTTNWLVEWPLRECKGIRIDEQMLCSGTTIGTRKAMLDYLKIMHTEMKAWMEDPKCHFKINGDDQSIHNYLYYTGKLPSARSFPNRLGIVNTVGAQSAVVKKEHVANMQARGITGGREAQLFPYPGSNLSQGLWIGTKFQLTDDHGYFTNNDGSRSFVIHQYDRYGYQLERWLQKYSGLIDT